MITAKALGSMPQYVRQVGGEKLLQRTFRRSGLPGLFVDQKNGYIPEHALATFVDEVARMTGETAIGVVWAPHLTVDDYGAWGAYVLSGPTLGVALRRAKSVMPFHSSVDRVTFSVGPAGAWYGYEFGLRDHIAYPNIAYSAIGAVLSIFRHYLGGHWTPNAIYLDFTKPREARLVEDAFQCPAIWDSRRLGLRFDTAVLSQGAGNMGSSSAVTLEDIARERNQGPPTDMTGRVVEVLRLQIEESSIDLDEAAMMLDLGARNLQRSLASESTTFRALANRVLVDRAKELLRDGTSSIALVSSLLGYEHPRNFTRAFKAQVGVTPSTYAQRARRGPSEIGEVAPVPRFADD